MVEGRKEERRPEELRIFLSLGRRPMQAEAASTENVSSHGLRVRTYRQWKQDSLLIVQSSAYELWARAKVIYCETLPDKTYALGLQLEARTGEWIMRLVP